MKRVFPLTVMVIAMAITCSLPALAKDKVDRQAIESLVSDLKSGTRQTRDAATKQLISIGSPALPLLIKALDNPDHQTQEFAAGIIGNIGNKAAVPALLKALEKKPPRRYAIVWALGKIKDERAIPTLIEAFRDERADVRKTAMRSLLMIASPAVPYLIARINDPDPIMRVHVITSLGELGVASSEELVLRSLKDPDDRVREAACRALGYLGSVKSVGPLSEMIEDPNWRVRINAINALGLIGDASPVPLIEKTITDQRFIVREWSSRALANITGKRYKYLNENNEMVFPYNMYH